MKSVRNKLSVFEVSNGRYYEAEEGIERNIAFFRSLNGIFHLIS
jgi:hypothetical protein